MHPWVFCLLLTISISHVQGKSGFGGYSSTGRSERRSESSEDSGWKTAHSLRAGPRLLESPYHPERRYSARRRGYDGDERLGGGYDREVYDRHQQDGDERSGGGYSRKVYDRHQQDGHESGYRRVKAIFSD